MDTATTTASKPTIRRKAGHTFEVSSRTRPDRAHTVDALRLRCSCEAGRHRTRCWHLVWALQAEQWLNRAALEHDAQVRGVRP